MTVCGLVVLFFILFLLLVPQYSSWYLFFGLQSLSSYTFILFRTISCQETQKWGKNKSKESWESWGVLFKFLLVFFYLRLSSFLSPHIQKKVHQRERATKKEYILWAENHALQWKAHDDGSHDDSPSSHWTPLWSPHMIISRMFFLWQEQQGWVRQTDFQG